jgi:predicted GIY-YIG superfamily endonuclease
MTMEFLAPTFIALRNAGWTWNRKKREWQHTSGRTAKNMDDAYRVAREIYAEEVHDAPAQ